MAKKKILVIDDEKDTALEIQKILHETGKYEVSIETDSGKSVEAVRRVKPAFIFLDMKMPGLNGFDVIHLFEADETLKKIPVVFLTGALTKHGPTASPADDHRIGNYPYVLKPVTSQTLEGSIEKYALK